MTNINPIFLFFPISLAALPFSLLFFKKRRLSLALSSFFFVCGLLFLIWGASFPIGGIEGKYMMVSLYLSAPLLLSCLLFFSLNIFIKNTVITFFLTFVPIWIVFGIIFYLVATSGQI